jgi:hypothetical protein
LAPSQISITRLHVFNSDITSVNYMDYNMQILIQVLIFKAL